MRTQYYIYLDIDGVLTSESYLMPSDYHMGLEFNPLAIQHLRFLLKDTNARLIISSSRRLPDKEGQNAMYDLFRYYDLHNYLAGQTPILLDRPRWEEIMLHMDHHHLKNPQIIVIDDDDFDIKEKLGHRLVKVDRKVGFSLKNRNEAMELLMPLSIKTNRDNTRIS